MHKMFSITDLEKGLGSFHPSPVIFFYTYVHSETMSEETETSNKKGSFILIVVLCAIILGLLMYYFQVNWIVDLCVPLVLIGLFEIGASFNRATEKDQFGTSESGAAMFWGFTFLAIGGAGIVFALTGEWVFVIIFALVMGVIYLLVKKRD